MIEEIFSPPVKIINKKTGEIYIPSSEVLEKVFKEVKEKWIDGIINGYYRPTD